MSWKKPRVPTPKTIKQGNLRLDLIEKYLSSPPIPPSLAPPTAEPITLVCVSDTHNTEPEVPNGDVFLHSGDLTQLGTFDELQAQIDWIKSLPHKYKVVIAGNHEVCLDDTLSDRPMDERQVEWGDIIYLNNEQVTLEFPEKHRSINIFGSPYSLKHGRGAFSYPPSEDYWANKIPKDIDVFMVHGPPKGYLDISKRPATETVRNRNLGFWKSLGCPHLLKEIWRARPRVVIFGHIHGSRGQWAIKYTPAQRIRDAGQMGQIPSWSSTLRAIIASTPKSVDTLMVNASTIGPWGPRNDPTDRYTVLKI